MLKERIVRFFVLVAAGLLLGGLVALWQYSGGRSSGEASMAGVPIGGPFTLTDHTGKTVTEKDFPGYKLVYFGFTFCPAICPTELQKMTLVMDVLGEKGDLLQPLFITVDPERDTVEAMRAYVKLFHPRLTGLTGSREQIDAALKTYRVYAAKAQDEGMADYTMDHSSFTYLITPDDKLLAIYKLQDKAEDIARDITNRIGDGS